MDESLHMPEFRGKALREYPDATVFRHFISGKQKQEVRLLREVHRLYPVQAELHR